MQPNTSEASMVSQGIVRYLMREENAPLRNIGLQIFNSMDDTNFVEKCDELQKWGTLLAKRMDASTWLNRNWITSSWEFKGLMYTYEWQDVVNDALFWITEGETRITV